MLLLKPDPTFYPSAKLAMQAPAESLPYVAAVQRPGKPDALRVMDPDANSPIYGQFVHTLELPYIEEGAFPFSRSTGEKRRMPKLKKTLGS